jgi:hypothetical protein
MLDWDEKKVIVEFLPAQCLLLQLIFSFVSFRKEKPKKNYHHPMLTE